MKISEKWLREWVDPPCETRHVADQLTMAGLEVEGQEQVSADFSGVIAARVESVEGHPDADALKLCRVNAGNDEILEIVCGAGNVRQGMRVALATIGAKLPGGNTISSSAVRGVASQGMLCSALELGLAEESDGLLELPGNIALGQSLTDLVGGTDTILEVALTPNRGDCLSIRGIAREVAVSNQCPFTEPEIIPVIPAHDAVREVHLEAGDACPHYAGRKISGIHNDRLTPLWLREKLHRSGIRSINPVVDITNFVMLELGQPMHAFDDDSLQGDIHVRYARQGEQLNLLDEQTCEFDDGVLLITDDSRPLAMAGVMGGLESAVTGKTANVFLESAFFDPRTISGVARQYGLHTDSSHRFERGVDYTLQAVAIERATQLIVDICDGEPGPVTDIMIRADLPVRSAIRLNATMIERLLGIQVPADTVANILEYLGMQVEVCDSGWQVTPPPYRFDIAIEVDLIEEIARITGYDNIPDTPPRADLSMFPIDAQQTLQEKVRFLLVNRGYHEAITYSFVDEQLQQLLNPEDETIALANPIAADMSVMRTSLWPGLLNALQHNSKRQQPRVRLFETGLVYKRLAGNISQVPVIGGVICGNTYQKQWDIKENGSDFFDIKCDIEEILAVAGIARDSVTFVPATHAALHPGQSAEIVYDNQLVGKLGALHPVIQSKMEIAQPVYVFEVEISYISKQISTRYRKISKFPTIKRDIAILVDEAVTVAELAACIRKIASDYLVNLELFDVYQGEGIDLGKKSLAICLTFQGSSSTLTDEEVEAIMGDILAYLQSELGGTLRE